MTTQEHAAAVAALPTVAFESIPSVHVHGGKRKRTEAERGLKRAKKELTISNQSLAKAQAELGQLRQENEDLFNELELLKPDLKRRKIMNESSDTADTGPTIKTEGKIEIKKETNEE